MSMIGNEFSGLPIADLIGGPLKAACDAQIRLAKATADFITTVGFNPDIDPVTKKPLPGKLVPRQVDFSFWQPVPITQAIIGITITNGGSGYTSAPTVSFSGGGGTGAAGTAILDGDKVTRIDITNSGSGFTSAPTVSFSGGGGTGAAAAAAIAPKGEAQVQKVVLSVPFLAIVNVPALMVKNVDITFDMEVKSSESHKDDNNMEASLDLTAKVDIGIFSAEVKIHGAVSAHQENTRSTDRSAKYHVQVQARDDGMPEGLSRVLDILQKAIAPVSVSKATDLASANIAQNHKAVA